MKCYHITDCGKCYASASQAAFVAAKKAAESERDRCERIASAARETPGRYMTNAENSLFVSRRLYAEMDAVCQCIARMIREGIEP